MFMPFHVIPSPSHCGLAVEMIDYVIVLANELIGFLVLLDYRVAHLGVLILQLFVGKVLHNAGPEGVAENIRGSTQTVPGVTRERE